MMPPEFAIDVVNKFHAINFAAVKKFLSTPLNPNQTEWHLIPNTGSYSPAAYLPQAVTAFVGRRLNLSAGIIYYAMSLSALIFATACIFAAMKLLPEKKFLIFLLASMPMFLVEITSTAADAVIHGICFAGTAWLLSLRRLSTHISDAQIFALIIFAVTLGLLKQVYGAILLLYFLIPCKRFGSFARFVSLGIFLCALELLTSAAWMFLSSGGGQVPLFTGFYMGLEGIDAAAQKNFILTHPAEFFAAFATSLTNPDVWFAKTFVGILGIVNVLLPQAFYLGYTALLIVAATFGSLNLSAIHRAIIFSAAFVTFVGVFAIEYLVWSPVGGDVIAGVQGRYFIPIALMTFSGLSLLEPPKFASSLTLIAGTFSAALTVWITYSRFWM